LAIVKRIVEFYQGRIWVEDSSEQGCTVTFSLHLLAAEALRQDALTSSETASDIKNKASRTF
jgi:K+-sensing histidine kinase KdpD